MPRQARACGSVSRPWTPWSAPWRQPAAAARRITAPPYDPGMDQAQAYLDARAEEMAGLLAALVALDTENPPGRGLGACAAVLREALGGLGLSPEVIEVPPAGELED